MGRQRDGSIVKTPRHRIIEDQYVRECGEYFRNMGSFHAFLSDGSQVSGSDWSIVPDEGIQAVVIIHDNGSKALIHGLEDYAGKKGEWMDDLAFWDLIAKASEEMNS